MTDNAAQYVRDAAADYDARATVDSWDRLDTANRELAAARDRLANALAAAPAPQPEPEPSTVEAPPSPPALDPGTLADRIHGRRQ
jgi:hypothetical protein